MIHKLITILLLLTYIMLLTQVNPGLTKKTLDKRYKLHRVLIFSRHNLRTPVHDSINLITPKTWPSWKEKSGELTSKGALLEGYLGEYFAKWLREENILTNACPTKNDIFIYANVKQRTIESAKAFARKGFPDCNIKIHHKNTSSTDLVFNPVIHNGTKEFENLAFQDMEEKLAEVNVTSIFEKLNGILDVRHSEMCRSYNHCDLAHDRTIVKPVIIGKAPPITGPLKLSNAVVDAFLMEYYNGNPQVAWGNVANEDELGNLVKITKEYHSVVFNTTIIARDIAYPLIKFIRDIFKNKSGYPTVSLLMGHDANMLTLLKSLNFIPKELPNQVENTPVGGKIVFQKWLDRLTGSYYLKINFIYLTPSQMRNGIKISKDNLPQHVTLELKDCSANTDGLCPWEDFISLLDGLAE